MRVCDAALAVLLETKNPSVMYGDEWLCRRIADRMQWAHEGPYTSRRVLRALSKTPGRLIKGLAGNKGRRRREENDMNKRIVMLSIALVMGCIGWYGLTKKPAVGGACVQPGTVATAANGALLACVDGRVTWKSAH